VSFFSAPMLKLVQVFTLVLSAIQLVCSNLGFGLHVWNFDFANYKSMLIVSGNINSSSRLSQRMLTDTVQLNYTGELVYTFALVTVKLGILMLYLRIFSIGGARWFRWTIIGVIIFGVLHAVGFGFALIFQCWPISAVWDKSIVDAKCTNYAMIVFTAAILSIIEDFLLVLLPIPELRKLQVSGRKRFGVGVMFAIASL
jgi:hypothetical protein